MNDLQHEVPKYTITTQLHPVPKLDKSARSLKIHLKDSLN